MYFSIICVVFVYIWMVSICVFGLYFYSIWVILSILEVFGWHLFGIWGIFFIFGGICVMVFIWYLWVVIVWYLCGISVEFMSLGGIWVFRLNVSCIWVIFVYFGGICLFA